ncbi:APC family permease, partial [Kibdelosporangium philippinense]|uniref:APC family permease n=1 Tax=Kibdelosporangium philippinense TaxID=211113 RepID=UPI00360FCF37
RSRAPSCYRHFGGVIFVVLAYATQLAHPGDTFRDESSAALEIAGEIGGNLMTALFLAAFMVAQLASGIATQAGASRLMFAMGRDGVLPKRVFAYLHPKLKTHGVRDCPYRTCRFRRPDAGRDDVHIVHQLRGVHHVHVRQHLRDRDVVAAARVSPDSRGVPGDRRGREHLAAHAPRRDSRHARRDLAGARFRQPHVSDPGFPPTATRNRSRRCESASW